MKRMMITTAAAVLSLGLAACGGGETADDQTEATETEGTEEAEAVRPEHFFVDEAGVVNEAEVAAVEERLGALFDQTGKIALITVIRSTDGQDIEEAANAQLAESGADAMILIAGGDQALAIVGEGLDAEGATAAEQAMVDAFDNNQLGDGFAAGTDFLVAQLGGGE